MLPSLPNQDSSRIHQDEDRVEPGSWWRLVDENHSLAEHGAPDHGLILLVADVRIVDGADHTIILQSHPSWPHVSTIRILRDDFVLAFRPEPEGAALREIEISAIMNRISSTAAELQSPPSPEKLLPSPCPAGSATDRDMEAVANHPQLPAALFPSKDILAAQKQVETQIAGLEAQQRWITEKNAEMAADMKLVSAFQNEKVIATTAGISRQAQHAQEVLSKVQTIRIFLGEDIEPVHLAKGASAGEGEPLTFLQRMLYLDEEIHVSNVLDGFDHSMMQRLEDLFSTDATIRDRMLPYPRCVAISRIRRDPKKRNAPKDILEALSNLEEDLQDEKIQIFIRDGENVWMVIADETTSKATRLFPSKTEIDGLFQRRSFGGAMSSMISPDDLDYSDARMAHDQRALFYKRFLIMFWGLHERAGLFGPFMPKGQNWLEQTVHDQWFRFIHDDENGIEDGWLDIHDFIEEKNAGITAKSRVVIKWMDAANEVTAPTICSLDRKTYETVFDADFREGISLAQVKQQSTSLVVRAPVRKFSMRSGTYREFSAPVNLRMPETSVNAAFRDTRPPNSIHEAKGFILLDDLTLSEVDYYIASRKARKHYSDYMHLFETARDILRQEEDHLSDLFRSSKVAPAALEKAIRMWRETHNWILPSSGKQSAAIEKLARAVAKAMTEADSILEGHPSEYLQIVVQSNGKAYQRTLFDSTKMLSGIQAPWLVQSDLSGGGSKLTTLPRYGEPGACVLVDTLHDGLPLASIPEGLYDHRNKSIIDRLSVEHTDTRDLLRLLEGAEKDDLLALAIGAYHARAVEDRLVVVPHYQLDIGLVVGPDRSGTIKSWMVSAHLDAPALVAAMGMREELMPTLEEIYRNPKGHAERLDKRRAITLCAHELTMTEQLFDTFEDGLSLRYDSGTASKMLDKIESPDLRDDIRAYVAALMVRRKSSGFVDQGPDQDEIVQAVETMSYVGSPATRDILKASLSSQENMRTN